MAPLQISASDLAQHGWPAVPRSQSTVLSSRASGAKASITDLNTIQVPDTQLARATREYAEKELKRETFSHSMRVYYYGKAIMTDHFPEWKLCDETYFLTCMLHDIGTTSTNLEATLLSFEFHGANVASAFLKSHNAPQVQEEAVVEAIIRHQDLGDTGTITTLGQIVQLATVFDNVGMNPDLVARDLIDGVCKEWKREKWSGCFAGTVREEIRRKPWCHSTHIDGFAEKVEGNKLMEPWE